MITAEHLKVVVEAETRSAEDGYKRVEARGDALSSKLGGMSKIADAAAASLKTVATPAIATGLTSAGKAADDVAGSMKNAAKGAQDFGSQKSGIKSTGDALGDAGRSADGLADNLQKIGLASLGIGALKSAIQGLAAPLQNAMSLAGDLQQSVANIGTLKDIDLSKTFADLNELSTRVPETATGLADAMYNIFSSIEVSYDDAIKLTESFSKGATAAQTSAETFGSSILGVMNAYGLAANQATHISDVFFNTVKLGVVTGQELASSLGPVTQAAKAAGVQLDELGGFIAGVTKEGGPAAQNINNLANLFSKITTNDAQKAINDLGVATVDVSGKFRPMTAILTDLKSKLGGMTEAAKLSAIQAIFPDAQARTGALVLMNQIDFVKAAIQSNIHDTGAAASAYEKMSNTYNTQTKLMQNTMDKAWREMGAQILPAITPIITAVAEKIPEAMHTAGDAVAFFAKHAEIVKPVMVAAAGAVTAVMIPATVRLTTALAAQAVAAAAAYAPFVALGAVVATAAYGIIKFADSLDIEINNTRKAQQAGEALWSTMTKQAAATGPLIQEFVGFTQANSDLNAQLSYLNNTFRNFQVAGDTANATMSRLSAAGRSNTTEAHNAAVAWTESQTSILGLQEVAKGLGFELQITSGQMTGFGLNAQKVALASQQEAASLAAAAEKADALAIAAATATRLAVPFGAVLEDIRKKAKEGADALDLAWKAIDTLTGKMTGVEQHNTTLEHGFDVAGKAAQAAFSAQTKDKIAEFAKASLDAATNAGLTGKPLAEMARLLPIVGQGGDVGEAALKKVKEILEKTAQPLKDENQLLGAQRTLAGDLAKEQLGLAGSMDALKGSLDLLVKGLMDLLRELDPNLKAMRASMTKNLDARNELSGIGAGNAQAFIAGIESKAGLAAGAARKLAAEGPANLNNRPLWLAMGVSNADGFIAGIESRYGLAAGAARKLAAQGIGAVVEEVKPGSPSKVTTPLGESFGEGFAVGILAWVGRVAAAAKQMTDEGTTPIKSGVQTMIDVMVQSVPAVSALAASLASLSANSMRPLLQMVANFDVAIAQLKVKLANTTAESAEAKAIEAQIAALERAKLAYSSTIDAHAAYQRALELARTPADVFSARRGEITQRATNVTNYGEGGASIVDTLMASLTDPAQAGRLADGVNTLLGSQAFKDLPNAGALGTEIWDAALRALNDPSPVNMQWLLNLLGQAETQTRTRIEAMKPTFQTALADALSFDTLSGQVGSSTATLFTNTAAAIDAGKELPIQALGRFRADSIAELTKLPTDMQTTLGPLMAAAWDEFVANPSKEALAKLQGIYGQIHAATAIIPAGYAAMLPDAQAFINQFVQMNRDGALSVEEAHERAGAAAMLFPKGLDRMMPEVQTRFAELRRLVTDGSLTVVQAGERAQAAAGLYPAGLRKMLPETQTLIRMIGASYLSGAISIEDATDRIADAQNIIPDGLRKMTPGVQAEIASIVEAWRRGALDIRTANEMIADAAKRSADATAAAAADMEKSLSRLIALQYQAGHQAVQSGPTNTSMTGGPSGTDISSSIVSNYAGILGLIASTITDSFGTFLNYSFPQALVDAYGGNIAAILYDLDHHLGVFMTQEEINTRLGLSAANLNNQAAIAAGQASHTNQGAANTNNTAAAAIANAATASTNASEMFGAHVDGFGNIVNDLGQLLSAAPGSGDEISERAMNERRRQWEKENPGKGPAPFRSGGFIPNYTGLTDMRTGKLFATMSEPGTGGEYIVPKQAMRSLTAPNSTQSSATGGGSGSTQVPVTYVTQNNTMNITQLPGESGDQFAKRVVAVLKQQNQKQM